VKTNTKMSAKIFLRRLTDMSTFDTLQDKLSRLNDTYLVSIANNTRSYTNTLPLFNSSMTISDRISILMFFLVKFMRFKCISMYWYYWAQCTCSTRTFQTSQSRFSWRQVFLFYTSYIPLFVSTKKKENKNFH